MHYLNRLFDKIYVISYESNYKQHEYIKTLLGERNIEYELFLGADASKINNLYEMGYNKSLKPPQICCSLSHLWLYLKIFQEKQNNFLILEDDVYFLRDINQDEIEKLENLNWDILYLGFNNACSNYDIYMRSELNKINSSEFLLKLNDYRFPCDFSKSTDGIGKFFEGTSSIAIKNYLTLNTLIKELEIPEKLFVIDSIYNKLIAYNNFNIYALYPQIFSQLI